MVILFYIFIYRFLVCFISIFIFFNMTFIIFGKQFLKRLKQSEKVVSIKYLEFILISEITFLLETCNQKSQSSKIK